MTHAQERLKERYGFCPTKKLVNTITRWIRHNSPKVRYIKYAGGNAGLYRIRVKRKRVIAVYDHQRDFIVTFLPEGIA